jgi:hypothetical protein
VLVQSVPLLITNNALGGLADAGSASVVLLVCASALALATTLTAVGSDLGQAGRFQRAPRSAGVGAVPVRSP